MISITSGFSTESDYELAQNDGFKQPAGYGRE